MHTTRVAASLAVSFSLILGLAGHSANGQTAGEESMVSRTITDTVERMQLLVKSSRILTLEGRIPRFQVHNETVLAATPISQNEIQVFAKQPGTTQLNIWDTDDKLYTVDVTVIPDAREVEGILNNQLPLAALKVLPINNSAVVSGTVNSVDDVDRAIAILEQYYAVVVNNIRVVGVQQVLLHTRIMEVSRSKLRQLGIDWQISSNGDVFNSSVAGLLGQPAFVTSNQGLSTVGLGGDATNVLTTEDFFAFISALREQNLVKLLAEPTLVATHGRPARFNVGGQIPYLVPSGQGNLGVQYEEYGTSIDFLPFVVGPGRIRLEVRPEVTEPDSSRSLTLQGAIVTAFTQRVIETSVEMQAGQTMAVGGLLQTRTESATRATPFFGELPYVGSLFRRIVEERNDIELLVTVTPELVAAMDPFEVPIGGPGLNSMSPNDKELYWKGHLEVPNLQGDHCGPGGPQLAPGFGSDGYGSGHHNSPGMQVPAVVEGMTPAMPGQALPGSAPMTNQTRGGAAGPPTVGGGMVPPTPEGGILPSTTGGKAGSIVGDDLRFSSPN